WRLRPKNYVRRSRDGLVEPDLHLIGGPHESETLFCRLDFVQTEWQKVDLIPTVGAGFGGADVPCLLIDNANSHLGQRQFAGIDNTSLQRSSDCIGFGFDHAPRPCA